MQKNERVKWGGAICAVCFSFFLSPVLASADGDGDQVTLEQYSKLRDKERLLNEQIKYQALKNKQKNNQNRPPMMGYPPYGMAPQAPVKKKLKYSIYSIRGVGGRLTALIIDNQGHIFYSHRGDHLPGGYLVRRIVPQSVEISKGRNIYPLGFTLSGYDGHEGSDRPASSFSPTQFTPPPAPR